MKIDITQETDIRHAGSTQKMIKGVLDDLVDLLLGLVALVFLSNIPISANSSQIFMLLKLSWTT